VENKHKNRNIVLYLILILLLTKVLGFIKLRIMAQLFGASRELDIFWASATIPDMIFNVLIGGSINAAIIPVLSDTLHNKGKKDLNKVYDHLLIIFFSVFSILSISLFILTPQMGEFLATSEMFRGFLDIGNNLNKDNLDLFIQLMRINLVSPLILGMSGLVTAYLQNYKKFAITSLAPLFYNLAMIVGSIVFVNYFNMGVEGLAISTLLGAVLHLLIQIPLVRKKYMEADGDRTIMFEGLTKDREVFKTIKLAVPRILGLLGEQVNIFVNTLISFTLSAGALSSYKFAYSLHLFPVNIIGGAIAQVSLPELSEQGCKGDEKGFKKTFNDAVQFSTYLILPKVTIIVILRLPVVRLSSRYGSI
jgi:putative peptidoglycan lipid II flippase